MYVFMFITVARDRDSDSEDCYILVVLLPAALRAAKACRYLIYSEADFEVFLPAGATRCTDGGEIWHGEHGGGDRRSPTPRSPPTWSPCQISPHRCNVSPLRGEKPQNWPLSKLNTGRFALRAMLPVKNSVTATETMPQRI